ncbi:MAG: bifunctional precorrin-2 dehydrogenase/sirohydrochlorin ferrochelatase [Coriobacteriales bacterium]|jgi:precorrin-2 dehydrogenase/sirohydrochlorin ferrochelatase|nr:bifunctional precorrin-2 dehydrogenase/sirohydrochlorin ferrochelatase [Coriobacteriales bacterium]
MTHSYNRSYYPAFLDLKDRRVLVIGAGNVGQRKIENLAEQGADVHVIAPQTTPLVKDLAAENKITYHARAYQKGDLKKAFLVVCATDNAEVNRAVYEEAEELGTLLNMVDYPPYCNFIVPSTLKRGPLQIAISTGGASPVVARTIRRQLEETYDDTWGDYVTLLGEVRPLVLSRIPGGEEARKPLFEAMAHANLFDRLEAGELLSAEQLFDEFAPAEFACKLGECASCDTSCRRAVNKATAVATSSPEPNTPTSALNQKNGS